jgi:heterodisulfide reductase subunit C
MSQEPTVNAVDVEAEFMADVLRSPEGEKIKLCIQCGTCSASCPTSHAMDYTPREIIAALRAGMLDRVLNSEMMWTCTSCYNCTTRCPQGIKLTDIMYELKRLAIKHNLSPGGRNAAELQKAFVEEVERYGRNPESSMMTKFYLRTNPFEAIRNLPFAARMWQRGRIKFLGHQRIAGQEQLAEISRRAKEAT